ncbi:MAG: GNAT family N-acetyltransferase [Candidatus Eremiobacteraeota bacterium]|nr:GNAT family N-acetyltransferase [Candidatus Eremiobacteraeota bacterium]MBC5804114.1 GNAT family N-acetyltransferase [Candidatus Eremiobacteraeota bacterium]MBC5820766.1 GNAT family N-acetyltransferase [Candidatus Eremiobacteraeota bacterium]
MVPLFLAYLRFYAVAADEAPATEFLAARLTRDESVIFLAHEGEQDLGFAQLYPTFASLEQKRLWILEDLFVVPERRRHGIGAALLSRAEQHGRETGAVRLRLETAHDNASAQSLYEAAGWQRDAIFLVYNRDLT